MNSRPTLLPEWVPQAFVLVAWPHPDTDWAPCLDEARRCFAAIIRAIASRGENVLVIAPDPEAARRELGFADEHVSFLACPTDDTWTRDTAFLTLSDGRILDFQFNGWGLKFAAARDNQVNARIFPAILNRYYSDAAVTPIYTDRLRIVLEGGSVESDGQGTLLTTSSCLLAPNRNGFRYKTEAEAMLARELGAQRVLWLDHGHLEGDDTDGHIDTLARLCPGDTILYIRCDDPADSHYADLQSMEEELQSFRTADGRPYRLIPLPMAHPVYDEDGHRLPATYANYLVTDRAVLLPVYGQPDRDGLAVEQTRQAWPGREVVPIDCSVLIRQHGSLHCSTMQFPRL